MYEILRYTTNIKNYHPIKHYSEQDSDKKKKNVMKKLY